MGLRAIDDLIIRVVGKAPLDRRAVRNPRCHLLGESPVCFEDPFHLAILRNGLGEHLGMNRMETATDIVSVGVLRLEYFNFCAVGSLFRAHRLPINLLMLGIFRMDQLLGMEIVLFGTNIFNDV